MTILECQAVITGYIQAYMQSIAPQAIEWPNSILDKVNLKQYVSVDFDYYPAIPITLTKTKMQYFTVSIKAFNALGEGFGDPLELLEGLDDALKNAEYPCSLSYYTSSIKLIGNTISQTQTTTESSLNQTILNIDYTMVK